MNEDVIENMRSRVERFKKLASFITDKRALDVLEEMVGEAEVDIKRLEQRSDGEETQA